MQLSSSFLEKIEGKDQWEFKNPLSEDEFLHLSKILNSEQLSSLQLSYQPYHPGEKGFKCLGQALEENQGLRKITLEFNNIENVEFLANFLEKNTTLKELNLNNNRIQDESVIKLANTLKVNKTLESLNLHKNDITDLAVISLAESLETNSTLKKLNLSSNSLTSNGLQALIRALEINNSLEELDLVNVNINNQDINLLAAWLKKNPALKQLSLSFNNIDDMGAQILADALKLNTTLEVVNFEDNNITEEGVDALVQLFETNFSLKKLNYLHADSLTPDKSSLNQRKKYRKIRSFEYRNKWINQLENLIYNYVTYSFDNVAFDNVEEILKNIERLQSYFPDLINASNQYPLYINELYYVLQALVHLYNSDPESALDVLLTPSIFDTRLQPAINLVIARALMLTTKFQETTPEIGHARFGLIAYGAFKLEPSTFNYALLRLLQPSNKGSWDEVYNINLIEEITGAHVLLDYETILKFGKQALKDLHPIKDNNNSEYTFLTQLLQQTSYDAYSASLFWQSPTFQQVAKKNYPHSTIFRSLEDCLMYPNNKETTRLFVLNEEQHEEHDFNIDTSKVNPLEFSEFMTLQRKTVHQNLFKRPEQPEEYVEVEDKKEEDNVINQKIMKAIDNYLTWLNNNAIHKTQNDTAKWRFRFTHLFHGIEGYNRIKKLKETQPNELISATIKALEASGNHKHSFSRFLFEAIFEEPNIFNLSSKDFSTCREKLVEWIKEAGHEKSNFQALNH